MIENTLPENKKLTDKCYVLDSGCDTHKCGFHEIFCRLKEYENLGFTPEEIREIIFEKTEKRFLDQNDKCCSEEVIELAFKSGIEVGKRLGKG